MGIINATSLLMWRKASKFRRLIFLITFSLLLLRLFKEHVLPVVSSPDLFLEVPVRYGRTFRNDYNYLPTLFIPPVPNLVYVEDQGDIEHDKSALNYNLPPSLLKYHDYLADYKISSVEKESPSSSAHRIANPLEYLVKDEDESQELMQVVEDRLEVNSLVPKDFQLMNQLVDQKFPKYFRELNFKFDRQHQGRHYDARFFTALLSYAEKRREMKRILRAWLAFCDRENIVTWLAHGSLLSWYWNAEIFPWDCDADVQVPISQLIRFANDYNATIIEYKEGEIVSKYLIDVNPFYVERVYGNGNNVIDMRFIDLDTGLFIDVTGLAVTRDTSRRSLAGRKHATVQCKDDHRYKFSEIFPLHKTIYEGVKAYVPYNFEKILVQEYGMEALCKSQYSYHTFDRDLLAWIPTKRDWAPDYPAVYKSKAMFAEQHILLRYAMQKYVSHNPIGPPQRVIKRLQSARSKVNHD
ncbi:hypothetical protein CANCADRAFT_31715 [Tortispora caseinolytica NRRL Y-17796]|uniref:LicD/FKTN/FKRP nucleotidyltransferase domain-containing protein n=1 Tax=Tortispora caseinolytica NRRL Y-17796 TaxID=767744 RepID=A0A1E4TGI0_9ASCO|nr:hypothetical protein CANCADRAFT_31715 [Tortispora caseinolytica NRRL Y-17796]